jgi:hypothetical protein
VTYFEFWSLRLDELVRLLARKADILVLVMDNLRLMYNDVFPQILNRLVPDPALQEKVAHFNQKREERDARVAEEKRREEE